MPFSGKEQPRIDSRPKNWDCTVHAGQFENGRSYRFQWELPLNGGVVFGGQTFLFDGIVEAEADMQRQGARVIANIQVHAKAEALCSRCLEKTGLALDHEFRYFYVSSSDLEEGRTDDIDDHTVLTDGETRIVDIADQIWETLIMAFPEKVLCRTGCKGLCPVCGCNFNHEDCSCEIPAGDPRLAALAEVLSEETHRDGKKGGTKNGCTQE